MNIIELAKQAGCAIKVDSGKVGGPWTSSYIITPDIERFAALVLEEAAKVCDKRYMGDNNREDLEARRCADAIRALKGAKE